MLLSIILYWLAVTQVPANPAPSPVKLYLGGLPSKEGFVTRNSEFEESYRDIREEYVKDRSFQKELVLVNTFAEADVVMEIVSRGLRDTGIRTGSATVISGTTVVGNSVPVRQRWLIARLVVPGTEYNIDLDGHTGIKVVTYKSQARNLLRQVVDWTKANRQALAKARSR